MKINKNTLLTGALIWIAYSMLYALTIHLNFLQQYNGLLALVGEAGLDLVCAILAYQVFRKSQHPEKQIFLLITLAFSFAIISDTSYNIIVNILQINKFPPALETLFDLPFGLFLLLQTTAWLMIFRQVNKGFSHQLHRLLFLPSIVSALVIFITFFFLLPWHVDILSTKGIYNIIDTLLEVISFAFVITCLFSAKNNKIQLLAAGYLVVIASDLVIRFTEIENILYPGSPLETTWVLGLMLFAAGLLSLLQDDNFKFKTNTFSWSSLKIQMGYVLFNFCLTTTFMTLLVNTVFKALNIHSINAVPIILIIFAVLSALLSNLIFAYIKPPILRLNAIVKNHNEQQIHGAVTAQTSIEELTQLETCLKQGLQAIKNKHLAEDHYLTTVKKYADTVRGPATAVAMIAEDIEELAEEKRIILKKAIHHLTTTTNNFLHHFYSKNTGEDSATITALKYVVVDDNKNLTMAWEMEAAELGIDLTLFNNPDHFMENAASLDQNAKIYIDANLNHATTGLALARWAYDHNFREISIITGGDQAEFKKINWIKAVYNKRETPFLK